MLMCALDCLEIEHELLEEILIYGYFRPLSYYENKKCYSLLVSRWNFYSSMTIEELYKNREKFVQMNNELHDVLNCLLAQFIKTINYKPTIEPKRLFEIK